jgi:EAL domain-containing protein (putative c-di-GMP-specific phosphodiesterase class I)
VRAIAQLAHSMSITTVAEYIETEAIGTRIAELGVDYGQGFAIGKPIPLSELLLELPLPSPPAELAHAALAPAGAEELAPGRYRGSAH